MVVKTSSYNLTTSKPYGHRQDVDLKAPVASTSMISAQDLPAEQAEVADDWETDADSSETDTTLVEDDRDCTPASFASESSFSKGKWREIQSTVVDIIPEVRVAVDLSPNVFYGLPDDNGLRVVHVPVISALHSGPQKVQFSAEPPWFSLPSLKQRRLPPLVVPRLRPLPKCPNGDLDPLANKPANANMEDIPDHRANRVSPDAEFARREGRHSKSGDSCLACLKDGVVCIDVPRETRGGRRCLVCRATDVKCEWPSGSTKRKASEESDVDGKGWFDASRRSAKKARRR